MKIFSVFFFTAVLAIFSAPAHAQVGSPIVRLDSALDSVASTDAKLEKLNDGSGLGTREGPVWVRKGGYLIYSVRGADKSINKWTPGDNTFSVFQDKTDADGITMDRQGRLVWAARFDAGGGQIVRLESDGRRTILAGDTADEPLKRPNDLVYKSDGSLYFTDTDTNNRRVYLLRDGKVSLLTKDLPYANGLAFAPGEKYLYIDDSLKRTITRFDVQPDGTILNGRVMIDMGAGQDPCPFPCPAGYPDGMKVDQKGNMYSTGPGGIWIISPDGKHLGTILVPDHPANLTFGDADGKTLYITSRPGLYRIRLKIAGIRP